MTLLPAGVAHSQTEGERVVLDENFETYADTEALLGVWKTGSGVLENAAPGGGRAVLHDGGELNEYKGFSVRQDATHDVVFSADFFDFGGGNDKRVTAALRNGSGAGLEFGLLNELGPYCFRIQGMTTNDIWMPFGPAILPSRGWHRFQAMLSATNIIVTLDLGRNGTIDHRFSVPATVPRRAFNSIRFGGLPGKVSHDGPVLVDNIRLTVTPVVTPVVAAPPPVAAIAPTPTPITAVTSQGWSPPQWGLVAG
ncbi:MAG TPA: hypothetical protein PKA41_01645, partial [Verrucomicrobiota bacterium]|nr:hypothetical protein [Verrucomicrobiota bacterium]